MQDVTERKEILHLENQMFCNILLYVTLCFEILHFETFTFGNFWV
jgi:hypothetical protein